jgi:Kef-type K+ transport system membrane component KefB
VHISRKFIDLMVIFGLLVVPRAIQRFRIPAPLTCFILGIGSAIFFKELVDDQVLAAVSTLGIASLFLFAGLDVDLHAIRLQLPRLMGHFATRGVFLALVVWIGIRNLHMVWQAAALLALALFTPSTGFILDTLPLSGLDTEEQSEVSISAVAGEILALLTLFVVSKSSSFGTFALSSAALLLLIVLTPLFFLALTKYVVPYAPGSEFSLLVMVGVICAVISNALGLHVLLGAFIAGFVASLLKDRMTSVASRENLQAVRLFASFFIPFYFFREGLEVPTDALVLRSLLYGVGLSLIVLPIRIAKNSLVCRFFCRRTQRGGLRVAVALTPTLIFTLVIARILRESYHIDDALYGGLLVYAALSTALPSFVLPRLTERVLTAMAAEAEA